MKVAGKQPSEKDKFAICAIIGANTSEDEWSRAEGSTSSGDDFSTLSQQLPHLTDGDWSEVEKRMAAE